MSKPSFGANAEPSAKIGVNVGSEAPYTASAAATVIEIGLFATTIRLQPSRFVGRVGNIVIFVADAGIDIHDVFLTGRTEFIG